MKEQKFEITNYKWLDNGYEPRVEFILKVEEEGFRMHIVAWEREPKREKTEHFQFVHLDSCVEWFVKFAPEICDRYFNFEINANGCMNGAFHRDRHDSLPLSVEDVEMLHIETKINKDTWEVDYVVPFAFIEKHIPGYVYKEGMSIMANFYKCGDETKTPHFGMWNPVDMPEPDFHRPEFFKEILV